METEVPIKIIISGLGRVLFCFRSGSHCSENVVTPVLMVLTLRSLTVHFSKFEAFHQLR